jgi:hypothetical protein
VSSWRSSLIRARLRTAPSPVGLRAISRLVTAEPPGLGGDRRGYLLCVDGVGWAGTAMILSPMSATILVVALLTAFATRRQDKRRTDGDADRR